MDRQLHGLDQGGGLNAPDPRLARVLAIVLALPVGAVVALVLTFLHRAYAVPVGATAVPLGLLAALALLAGLVVGIRLAFEDRAVALAAAVGALLAIGALLFVSPGRAEIFQNDVISSTWIAAPAVAALLALVIRPRRDRVQTPTD